jgi:hypothetical protein
MSECLLLDEARSYGSVAPAPKKGDTPFRRTRLGLLFAALIFVQAMINYDAGAIPSSLQQLVHKYDLDYYQQGLLGSLV